MAELKHKGFGKWFVVDGERDLAGPMKKDEALAWLQANGKPLEPEPTSVLAEPDPAELRRRQIAWERRLDETLRKKRTARAEKVRAVLLEDPDLDEDVVNRMMRDIEPILAAGREGRRRERVASALVAGKIKPPAKAA